MKKKLKIKSWIWEYRILIALIIICLFMTFESEHFLKQKNIISILRQVSINGLLSIGMTFVILTAGIDLSVGSLLAFGGIIAASFVSKSESFSYNLPVSFAIVIGMLASGILGAISGIIISKMRVTPFIMTLGMMSIARGLTYIYSKGMPITDLDKNFLELGKGQISDLLPEKWMVEKNVWWSLPIPVVIFILVFIIAWVVLYKMKFGRYVYAVGGNPKSARISGINVTLIIFSVYLISALLSGLGGVLLTARTSAGLTSAGEGYELNAIAAVVIGGTSLSGGRGSLFGTLIGVLLIGVINNGLDILHVTSYSQQVVKGAIIVGAVLLDYFKTEG